MLYLFLERTLLWKKRDLRYNHSFCLIFKYCIRISYLVNEYFEFVSVKYFFQWLYRYYSNHKCYISSVINGCRPSIKIKPPASCYIMTTKLAIFGFWKTNIQLCNLCHGSDFVFTPLDPDETKSFYFLECEIWNRNNLVTIEMSKIVKDFLLLSTFFVSF